LASNKVFPHGKSEVGGVDKEVSNAGERLADEQAAPPASLVFKVGPCRDPLRLWYVARQNGRSTVLRYFSSRTVAMEVVKLLRHGESHAAFRR